jgi:hypothetical protein
MRYKHPTPITDQLYKESSDDPNRDPIIHQLRLRIQCEKFEVALAEMNEQHGMLKDAVKNFLQIMRTQEESDSGRVFHPNTIQSCRAHDLDRISVLLEQMELMTNQEVDGN